MSTVILSWVIVFAVRTVILFGLLLLLVSLQRLERHILGLLLSAAVASALDTVPYVGHVLAVPALYLCVSRVARAPLFPDAVFTVAISYALMFGINIFFLNNLHLSGKQTDDEAATEMNDEAQAPPEPVRPDTNLPPPVNPPAANPPMATPTAVTPPVATETNRPKPAPSKPEEPSPPPSKPIQAAPVATKPSQAPPVTSEANQTPLPPALETNEPVLPDYVKVMKMRTAVAVGRQLSIRGFTRNAGRSMVTIFSGVSTYDLQVGDVVSMDLTNKASVVVRFDKVAEDALIFDIDGEPVKLRLQ